MDATTTMPSTASKRPKPKFEQGEIIAGRWKVYISKEILKLSFEATKCFN